MLGLAIVGLGAHFFGFALNDIIDRRLDQTVPARSRSPLVAGRVSLRGAWGFVLVQIPLALGLYHFVLGADGPGLAILGVSIMLSLLQGDW